MSESFTAQGRAAERMQAMLSGPTLPYSPAPERSSGSLLGRLAELLAMLCLFSAVILLAGMGIYFTLAVFGFWWFAMPFILMSGMFVLMGIANFVRSN